MKGPAAITTFFLAAALLAPAAASNDGSLRISHRARSLQPGEVVLLTVDCDQPLDRLQAKAFGKSFPFFAVSGDRWMGLVGIDLGVKAGAYRVDLEGDTGSGTVRGTHPLKVVGKKFPTRRLTVDEKFVTPPKEALPRIKRESAKISTIFAGRTDERRWRGPFESPVPGAPNSGFGKRSILNGKPRSPHTGTDFDADSGTPVRAPNAGVAVLAENLYYSGNTVILDHGMGLYSYFAHLSEFRSSVGDTVAKGDVVGLVGATGRVTGPHLHWTVRLAGTRVDPLSLMAALEELPSESAEVQTKPDFAALVFSKTAGFRHDSIPEGVAAVRELGHRNGFSVDATEDAAVFTPGRLAGYRAVIFLNTTQDVLDAEQENVLQAFVEGGGGFVGVHAAADTEYEWPWYGKLVGAYFKSHPKIQEAVIHVIEPDHPSTSGLPAEWKRTDEWYSFRAVPGEGVRILLKIDESSYQGGEMAGDHPMAWSHETLGGRAWYTALGHTKESYSEPLFLSHLLGGILWAAGGASN